MNDCRLAMIGNVDSGKSTLIGVLTSHQLDDGRGAARSLVLKHRHEQENGRTSAVTIEIMGYDDRDQQIIPVARGHHARWQEIVGNSSHSVTLIDLCGHEKYLKTTLFGLTGILPYLYPSLSLSLPISVPPYLCSSLSLSLPICIISTSTSYSILFPF